MRSSYQSGAHEFHLLFLTYRVEVCPLEPASIAESRYLSFNVSCASWSVVFFHYDVTSPCVVTSKHKVEVTARMSQVSIETYLAIVAVLVASVVVVVRHR